MYSRFVPASPVLQRQHHNRGRFSRPFYRYVVDDNLYSDFYFDHHFIRDPWMREGCGARGQPHGHRFMVDAKSSLLGDYDDSNRQREGLRGRLGQGGGPSRTDAQSKGVAWQAAGEQKTASSFGKAMIKLHHQIEKSEQCYSSLRGEYDADIERFKKYASDKSLLSLWTLRIKGQRDSDTEGAETEDDDKFVEDADKIPILKDKLRDAFAEATSSVIRKGTGPSRKGKIRFESSKRLKEKVALASTHVFALLDTLPEGPEYCDTLLAELAKLKTWLEPSNSNGEVHKGGGYEEGE